MPLPKVYHPRAVVRLQPLVDNQDGTSTPTLIDAVPVTAEVTRNDARHADTAQVVLDYADMAIDPRMLADVLVTIHMEDALDPALPTVPTPLNLRFIGLADLHESELSEDASRVTLRCRDYTGIFLDFEWGQTPIPIVGTLQAAVELVRARVAPLTPPAVFLDPAAAAIPLNVQLGKTVWTAKKKASAWDVLSDLCGLFGLLPVWKLDTLYIQPPSSPDVGAALMMYGSNVARLSFKRDFREPKTKPVKVTCWDPVKGIALSAQWPPLGTVVRLKQAANKAKSGTPTVQVSVVTHHVQGQYTTPQLVQIAKRIHDEAAQAQVAGELETYDLTDLVGGSLLALGNGDTLVVQLGPSIADSIAGKSAAEAVAYLSDPTRPNPLNPAVAAILVAAWTKVQALATTFYVRAAHHRWDRDDGYSLRVEFINFLLG